MSLIIVEIVILIPSYQRYEQDLLKRYELVAAQFASDLRADVLMTYEDWDVRANVLVEESLIVGGAVYRSDGKQLAIFGEPPRLAFTPMAEDKITMAYDRDNHERYEVIIPPVIEGDVSFVLRINVETVQHELTAFLWRIIGLVLLIGVVVTAAIMLILNRLILEPILGLRTKLVAATENPADGEAFVVRAPKDHELGDVQRAFNQLLTAVATGVRQLDSKSKALESLNDKLEQKVEQRTKELIQTNSDLLAQIANRERAEAQAEHLATHDPVTSLPNAILFEDRVRFALSDCHEKAGKVAVMYFEAIGFDTATINLDLAGKNRVLRQLTTMLDTLVPNTFTLARLSGERFGLLIPDVASLEEAAQLGQDIVAAIEEPLFVKDKSYQMKGALGISVFPDDSQDGQQILQHAELALARCIAEASGVCFFVASLDERMQAMLELEQDMRLALKREEFEVFYQPKVTMDGGEIMGVEALIRWHHPEKGLVSPVDFIPIAERSGMIIDIGMWVLEQSCHQAEAWNQQGWRVQMAVNLSAVQFEDENLVQQVQQILARTGIDPKQLELEITESTVMTDMKRALEILDQLNELGPMLVVDDFGTGHSSLAYLKRFPVSKMKIDRSFVIDLETDPDSEVIAGAIIDLAHSLRLKVVAEGIETSAQWEHLRGRGCDEGQGYLFGRPMIAQDLTQMLQSQAAE